MAKQVFAHQAAFQHWNGRHTPFGNGYRPQAYFDQFVDGLRCRARIFIHIRDPRYERTMARRKLASKSSVSPYDAG